MLLFITGSPRSSIDRPECLIVHMAETAADSVHNRLTRELAEMLELCYNLDMLPTTDTPQTFIDIDNLACKHGSRSYNMAKNGVIYRDVTTHCVSEGDLRLVIIVGFRPDVVSCRGLAKEWTLKWADRGCAPPKMATIAIPDHSVTKSNLNSVVAKETTHPSCGQCLVCVTFGCCDAVTTVNQKSSLNFDDTFTLRQLSDFRRLHEFIERSVTSAKTAQDYSYHACVMCDCMNECRNEGMNGSKNGGPLSRVSSVTSMTSTMMDERIKEDNDDYDQS